MCVCVCIVGWLVFITLSLRGGARERGEKGRRKEERFWERRVDMLVGNMLHPFSFLLLLSLCVRVRYKCAGGRKLELNLNSCLDETAGTDGDTG